MLGVEKGNPRENKSLLVVSQLRDVGPLKDVGLLSWYLFLFFKLMVYEVAGLYY